MQFVRETKQRGNTTADERTWCRNGNRSSDLTRLPGVYVKMNMRDGFKGGMESEETIQVARRLLELGAHGLVLSGGADDDVHTTDLVDLVVLDLGEDQLLLDAQAVVAAAVKGVGVDAAEVADAGQGRSEERRVGKEC